MAVGTVAAMICGTVHGQVLFSDGFDSDANWTTQGTADTTAQFGYDYSTMGIPPSPNGGGTTVGLRMTANETSGAANEISALPTGLTVSGLYEIQFDFWANANGPFPDGGGGSTEFIGGGAGFNGGEPGRDGASLIVTGEGGSSRDYRLYKNSGEQFIESEQYNPALESTNGSDPVFAAAFPGQSAPSLQQSNYAQQTGSTRDGSAGFAWRTMKILVDSDAVGVGATNDPGIARFEIDGLWIGTVDNSNGGAVVDMTGGVGVIYADLFDSVSDNAELSFGLFDNFVVTQVPEPAGLTLLGLGGLLVLLTRRRKT
jgi:hypothetical protein